MFLKSSNTPFMPKIQASLALSRFKVIDLSRVRAGPNCVRILTDFGADVVRVEPPEGVDPNEAMFAANRKGGDFQNINRNKRSMTLNLKKEGAMDILKRMIAQADVVLDCSDNFATRYTLNKLCVELKKPLVSGAAIGFEGQVTVYDMRSILSPCYHCLFPDNGEDTELRCATNGVFAPLVGMIGTCQAAEALKVLMDIGTSLQGRLLLLDALAMEWRTIKLGKDPACVVCGI